MTKGTWMFIMDHTLLLGTLAPCHALPEPPLAEAGTTPSTAALARGSSSSPYFP
jgi:hypothetical protein